MIQGTGLVAERTGDYYNHLDEMIVAWTVVLATEEMRSRQILDYVTAADTESKNR